MPSLPHARVTIDAATTLLMGGVRSDGATCLRDLARSPNPTDSPPFFPPACLPPRAAAVERTSRFTIVDNGGPLACGTWVRQAARCLLLEHLRHATNSPNPCCCLPPTHWGQRCAVDARQHAPHRLMERCTLVLRACTREVHGPQPCVRAYALRMQPVTHSAVHLPDWSHPACCWLRKLHWPTPSKPLLCAGYRAAAAQEPLQREEQQQQGRQQRLKLHGGGLVRRTSAFLHPVIGLVALAQPTTGSESKAGRCR